MVKRRPGTDASTARAADGRAVSAGRLPKPTAARVGATAGETYKAKRRRGASHPSDHAPSPSSDQPSPIPSSIAADARSSRSPSSKKPRRAKTAEANSPRDDMAARPAPPRIPDLVGSFQTYVVAECTEKPCRATPEALPRLFKAHTARTYVDAQLDTLNPGWEPTIHTFRLTDKLCSKLKAQLEPIALQLERGTEGLSVSNRGGFHSDQYLFETAGSKALQLLKHICASAVRCAERSEFGRACSAEDAQPTHSWVNVSRPTDFNGLHDHTGATWSGCYYVRCPRLTEEQVKQHSGHIVFRTAVGGVSDAVLAQTLASRDSDTQIRLSGKECPGWCRIVPVNPVEGMLLLFPSWLKHCVMPLECDELRGTRISIAFNVGQENE